jgi:hypothetical protein
VNAVPTGNYSGTPTKTFYIKKLLRVELSNAKLLDDSDKIFIKVFDAAAAVNTVAVAVSTTSPVARADKTIAILTNGNPIVEVGNENIAHLDAAESRTRASDVDIASYIFDTDKLIIGGDIQTLSATSLSQASDVLAGTFINVPSKKVSYTAHMEGHSLDSDNRFQNFFRLCRAQVKDDADMTDELDNLNTSIIECFSATRQTYAHRHQGADAVLEMNGAILMSNHNHDGTVSTNASWEDVTDRNRNTTQEIMGSPNTNSDGTYVIHEGTAGDIPKNWLFISKIEQFDRLFLRMANNNVYDNVVLSQGARMPAVEMTAYYNNGTTWAPLEIIDGTNGLKNSGSIKFTVPSDWHKGTYLNVDSGDWDGPVAETESGGSPTGGPAQLWTTTNFPSGAYGFLLGINATITADDNRKLRMMNAWAYNNSHSQLIELVDPNHVSLNSIAIAQSISFGRTSKVMSVEDKFGKSDIRKLGASGGKITFGGMDLGGSVDDRKTMVGYQKNATPVFLDIAHKSDEITRFFGVVTQLSEDHPAGMMYPKWAVTMQISHILELSSTGAVNSDKISIGGALVDDGKYLL